MLSLLACALTLAQAPIDQPSRLRTVLPNGAVVLVEQVISAKSLSLQIFVSARSGGSFGERHLVEHLNAVGDGKLDERLESAGASLTAQTLREATVYQLDLPSGKLELGLAALRELLKPRSWTKEQAAKEVALIEQEGALRDGMAKFSEAAWSKAYGAAGAGPFEVSPAPVKSSVAGSDVAVVLSGNVPLDKSTETLRKELNTLGEKAAVAEPKRAATGGQIEIPVKGNAIAVPVPSYRSAVTAAVLSAALAVAAEVPDSFVTYTPSARDGLVILGTTTSKSMASMLTNANAAQLFASAKLLGKRWVQHQLSGLTRGAQARGYLLVQERDLRPETLRENVDAMTFAQFESALREFSDSRAVVIGGRPETKKIEFEPVEEAPAKVAGRAGIIEILDPSQELIHVQAVVALPQLEPSDKAYLPAITYALARGSQEYPRKDALVVTAGAPIRTTLMPDHIGISFTVPQNGLKGGLALLSSIVRSANMLDEDLQDPETAGEPWAVAIHPISYKMDRFSADRARSVYRRVFRPENISVAVNGRIGEGEAISEWQSRMGSWVPEKVVPSARMLEGARIAVTNPGGLDIIDFSAPLPASSAATYPRLLALFALGSGKGASLFQVVRQEMAVSYRQEAVVTPTPDGFLTRLLIGAKPGVTPENIEQIRSRLLKDVDSWTEVQRTRALAMAEGVFERGNPASPLYLDGPDPVLSDTAGRTFLAAYWQLKTGLVWNPGLVLTNLRDVPLKELQEAALEILGGKVRVMKAFN